MLIVYFVSKRLWKIFSIKFDELKLNISLKQTCVYLVLTTNLLTVKTVKSAVKFKQIQSK